MKKTIDIFCDIIDNFGDIGVVYRLSKELSKREYKVRIFTNKLFEVKKIIDGIDENLNFQLINGIEFYSIEEFYINFTAEVVIEAFAVDIPQKYIDILDENTKLIINLEYLSAEEWTEDCHLKNSFSPKSFIEKVFFMPGFTKNSGGLILDENYLKLVDDVKKNREKYFNVFFKSYGLKYSPNQYYVNVFTYDWNFKEFIKSLNDSENKYTFFVLDDKLNLAFEYGNNIEIYKIPYIDQNKFDTLLNLTDFNFVRGEESFVRAILSEIPFIWHIYPQEDNIHFDKLMAFLDNFKNYSFSNTSLYYDLFVNFNKKTDFTDNFIKVLKQENECFRNYKKYI